MRADHLPDAISEAARLVARARPRREELPLVGEIGEVAEVGRGVVEITGLPGLGSEELVRFRGGGLGMAFNLDPERVGVILIDPPSEIRAGQGVRRTGRVMDVPVGPALLGRVIDPAGRPRDRLPPPRAAGRWTVERPVPAITERSPVTRPLHTGIKVVDALVPVGRGQRELVVGDRQTGKTAVALDAIVAQRGREMVCVYCAIGQRSAAIAKVVDTLRRRHALGYTVVVATSGEDPAGLQFLAPYAAASIAEWFMREGRDVLVVFDDLTRHARAYRELSLLLRRPPGREAYPGDIFYIHSRLLERSTQLDAERGGGSMTSLPVVETEAQNISAYIPTNLISITDGQIYLSPRLFHQGVLPAVDVGRSVSRVGGKAQLPAFRRVVGDLRLAYTQFEELERYARYGARLEESRRRQLRRGQRVRAVLRQPELSPIPPGEQLAVLVAVTAGVFDDVTEEQVPEAEEAVRHAVRSRGAGVLRRVEEGAELSDEDRDRLVSVATEAVAGMERGADGDA